MSAGPLAASVGAGTSGVLREIGAGATSAIVMMPFCVSAGVLSFEPFGPDFVATGAASGILCAVSGGVIGALGRTSSFIVNMPSVAFALVQASSVAALVHGFGGDVRAASAFMPLIPLLTGLWLVGLAWSGLGRAVKFTPYPVVAGFLTGLSVLTILQQLPRLFGLQTVAELAAQVGRGEVPNLAMAVLAGGVLLAIGLSGRLAPRVPAVLVGLLVGSLGWHGVRALAPALDLGRTVGDVSLGRAALGLPLDPAMLHRLLANFGVLQTLLLTSLTLAVMATLDFTFALRTAENLGDVEGIPRRDLAGQGLSNLAAGLAGALPVTASISFTTLMFQSGGRSRLGPIALAFGLLLLAVAVPRLIAQIPIVVLAAILLTIGWRLWDRWCLSVVRDALLTPGPARVRARRNAAILGAVMLSTVLGQPIVGAAVGVLLSCIVFIVEMSRPVIRRELDGTQLASKRIRSSSDRAILAANGHRLAILDLQGVLFFGNADDLASTVRHHEGGTDILILDLRRVTDLDTSGASMLGQIAHRCRASRMRLMVAGASPAYGGFLGPLLAPGLDPRIYPDLDTALETAEDLILSEAGLRDDWAGLALHETDLAAGLSEVDMRTFASRLQPCRYPAGEALCRAGDPADRMWLITRGSVSVRVEGAAGARRIAGLGPGTSVGEMGLLDRRSRSADVFADGEVEALALSIEAFDSLLREEPRLGQSLLATIARMTAQRLRATSDELRLADVV